MHLVYNSNVSSVWSIGETARTDQWEQSSWAAMGSEGDKLVSKLFISSGLKRDFILWGQRSGKSLGT